MHSYVESDLFLVYLAGPVYPYNSQKSSGISITSILTAFIIIECSTCCNNYILLEIEGIEA